MVLLRQAALRKKTVVASAVLSVIKGVNSALSVIGVRKRTKFPEAELGGTKSEVELGGTKSEAISFLG